MICSLFPPGRAPSQDSTWRKVFWCWLMPYWQLRTDPRPSSSFCYCNLGSDNIWSFFLPYKKKDRETEKLCQVNQSIQHAVAAGLLLPLRGFHTQDGDSGDKVCLRPVSSEDSVQQESTVAINSWHVQGWLSVLSDKDKGPWSLEPFFLEKSRKAFWRRWPLNPYFLIYLLLLEG